MARKTYKEELEEMELGEAKVFPITKEHSASSMRSKCSIYGVDMDRFFKCETDRENRVVKVTRTR
ncbi:MAG: hypothetical protein E7068_02435 [Lentimicrobiaceae bacterium]|nr:hypothetical protein [Lentimicrobiaceae bacterium]MBR6775934.1 hypothetical protein [Bacteroidales bacterium]